MEKNISLLLKKIPIQNEQQLLNKCQQIAGLSIAQLASDLRLAIPTRALSRKGWVGQLIELALGATAGNQSIPDFHHLGIELKTLPINHLKKSSESTFVCSIPLLTIHQQTWLLSPCYQKLKRILWIPIEADKQLAFHHRRIGLGFLWSPNSKQIDILQNDWQELTTLIVTGKLHTINASMGQYLQIRPKAANAKSLCEAYDEEGKKILTLPRGFYLRACFTSQILALLGR